MKSLVATATLLLMAPVLLPAQTVGPRYAGQGFFDFGLGTGEGSTGPFFIPGPHTYPQPRMWQVGGGGERFLYKGLGVGAEAGIVKWTGDPWPGGAVTASGDLSYHFGRHARRGKLDPFVLGGLSFVGPTKKQGGRGTPAGNYGGGVNLWTEKHVALRCEFRDIAGATQYWPFPHYISFRFGVTFR